MMLRLYRSARDHRWVIANFVSRNLKVKYRGTILGYLWSLLEPAALAAIYWFIFVVLVERGEENFVLIVVLGLLPWTFFNAVVTGCTNALRGNAALIRRVQLPREVYLIELLASNAVVLCLNMLAVVPFMIAYRVAPGTQILLWPLAILMLAMIALGVGMVTSCANVIFRDVTYLLSVVLRLGMYLSAAIYPISMVPQHLRYWFLFNPIALCLSLARNAVMNRPFQFEPVHALSAAAFSIAVLMVGAFVFFRWERQAVKYL
jgi:ABC-2 type transport system permease protein